MITSRRRSLRLPVLISLLWLAVSPLTAQEAAWRFHDPLTERTAWPVYPGAEADLGYADLGRYIVAFIHGFDERTLRTWAWHTEDRLEPVGVFYRDTLGYPLKCGEVDHAEFMKQHWTLFLDLNLPDTAGRYVHCAAPGLDLFSPVYNYALQMWQGGTMIVFHR